MGFLDFAILPFYNKKHSWNSCCDCFLINTEGLIKMLSMEYRIGLFKDLFIQSRSPPTFGNFIWNFENMLCKISQSTTHYAMPYNAHLTEGKLLGVAPYHLLFSLSGYPPHHNLPLHFSSHMDLLLKVLSCFLLLTLQGLCNIDRHPL